MWIMLSFLIGLASGGYLMGAKWSSNADAVQRLEYRGRLYKVLHEKDFDLKEHTGADD